MKPLNITIAGLGWLGLPLGQVLKDLGHHVSGTTRSEEKKSLLQQNGWNVTTQTPNLNQTDILILNMPPDELQLDIWKSWNISPHTWIIFISSTSVYEESTTLVNEDSPIKKDHLLIQQENWIKTHKKWNILRAGGLFGGDRHPGKHLAGKTQLKHKNWPVNLLHLEDAIGFIVQLIKQNKQNEIFNVVGNEHRSREEFYSEYARKNLLTLPLFDLEDVSMGKTVDNKKAKGIYIFKF